MKYLCLIAVLFLASCQSVRLTIADRHYRSGIYFHFSGGDKTETETTSAAAEKIPEEKQDIVSSVTPQQSVLDSADDGTNCKVSTPQTHPIAPLPPCDSTTIHIPEGATTPLRSSPSPSPYVDWELIAGGFFLSLIVPFLFPFFLWLTARIVEDDRQWWAFLIMIVAFAASSLAVALFVQANPLWWLFYALAFAVSFATVIYISITP